MTQKSHAVALGMVAALLAGSTILMTDADSALEVLGGFLAGVYGTRFAAALIAIRTGASR